MPPSKPTLQPDMPCRRFGASRIALTVACHALCSASLIHQARLSQAGATVLALEKDYAFAERLEAEVASQPRFRIVQGDALRANIPELIDELHALHAAACSADGTSDTSQDASPPSRIKIVANLPYYITTDLLKILLPMGDKVEHVAFMLQHEVAERLTTYHPGVHLDGKQSLAVLGSVDIQTQRNRGCVHVCLSSVETRRLLASLSV